MCCRILLAQQHSHERHCVYLLMRQSEWPFQNGMSSVMCINMDIRDEPFHSIQPHKMSSPTPNSHFTSPKPSIDVDATYSTETEPEMCDCQNQLGHWDWSGVPHENLPELCKRSMGINIDNAPKSQSKGE
jgi:hypothetical protein